MRPDGTDATFAGLYNLNPTSIVNGFATWERKGSSDGEASMVLYSDKSGHWAITLTDRVADNRYFTLTPVHDGTCPQDMAWGVIKDKSWTQTITSVAEVAEVSLKEPRFPWNALSQQLEKIQATNSSAPATDAAVLARLQVSITHFPEINDSLGHLS